MLCLEVGKEALRGAFKSATLATIEPKLPCGSNLVVAKQALPTPSAGSSPGDTSDKPLKGGAQVKHLLDEVTCLMWAKAFLNEVYHFVGREVSKRGQPAFPIPQFHYVSAAIATDCNQNNDFVKKIKNSWLVEQRIIEEEQGAWRKYINNDSPTPLRMSDDGDKMRARFLCFTQHVQYMMTGKLAFVTDYQGKPNCRYWRRSLLTIFPQGGDSLLSDPQLITNPYVFC